MPLDMHEAGRVSTQPDRASACGWQWLRELLRHSESPPAMLLERLGPNLDELGMPLPNLLDTVAATLRSFWRPVAHDCDAPDRCGIRPRGWPAYIVESTWDDLGRPCAASSDRPRARLLRRSGSDAFDESRAVLVHGDAHGWNTLAAAGGQFKFVDPEGLRSEREHDLAIPMREYNEPLLEGDTKRLVRERAELLAAACDVDREADLGVGLHRTRVDRPRQSQRVHRRRRARISRSSDALSLISPVASCGLRIDRIGHGCRCCRGWRVLAEDVDPPCFALLPDRADQHRLRVRLFGATEFCAVGEQNHVVR